jgi:hypothetical protein
MVWYNYVLISRGTAGRFGRDYQTFPCEGKLDLGLFSFQKTHIWDAHLKKLIVRL